MKIKSEIIEQDFDDMTTLYAGTISEAALQVGVSNSISRKEAERLIKGMERELRKQKARIDVLYSEE